MSRIFFLVLATGCARGSALDTSTDVDPKLWGAPVESMELAGQWCCKCDPPDGSLRDSCWLETDDGGFKIKAGYTFTATTGSECQPDDDLYIVDDSECNDLL